MAKKKTKTLHYKKDEEPALESLNQTKESGNESVQTEKAVDQQGEAATQKVEVTAEDKLATLNDKYLRILAEYDNFRKRTERVINDIIKTASENLMRELLPILDNLDRATEHKNNKTTLDEYVKGIALIEDQLRAVLATAGLEAIEVVGKPFDPSIHDAVAQIETDEYESGIVTTELEKGYTLSGKVIRHPKVIVSN